MYKELYVACNMEWNENVDEYVDNSILTEKNNDSIIDPKLLPQKLFLLDLDYANERFYAFAPDDLNLKTGNFVIVPTKYGIDIARVCGQIMNIIQKPKDDIVLIIRLADSEDFIKKQENEILEKEAEKVFREKVKANNLNMKFIATHILPEESKILFFFGADGRVDFRTLVKDLVSVFKIRVELRQIGVRDETRFIGGIAPCGRSFCCNSITDKMEPVSIKMAKDEELSLNSNRISGHCGRLLCCLAYEHKWYLDINKSLPPTGAKMSYNGHVFKVIDVNRVTSTASLANDDGHTISVPLSRIKKTDSTWKII